MLKLVWKFLSFVSKYGVALNGTIRLDTEFSIIYCAKRSTSSDLANVVNANGEDSANDTDCIRRNVCISLIDAGGKAKSVNENGYMSTSDEKRSI